MSTKTAGFPLGIDNSPFNNPNGQIVIPKEVREKLGIIPGKKVLFRVVENHAEITSLPDDPIKAMRGMLKGGPSLARELLAERKRDNKLNMPSLMQVALGLGRIF